MSGTKSPKTLKAMGLLKDPNLTTKQVALRCGLTSTYVGYLRRNMEVEK